MRSWCNLQWSINCNFEHYSFTKSNLLPIKVKHFKELKKSCAKIGMTVNDVKCWAYYFSLKKNYLYIFMVAIFWYFALFYDSRFKQHCKVILHFPIIQYKVNILFFRSEQTICMISSFQFKKNGFSSFQKWLNRLNSKETYIILIA